MADRAPDLVQQSTPLLREYTLTSPTTNPGIDAQPQQPFARVGRMITTRDRFSTHIPGRVAGDSLFLCSIGPEDLSGKDLAAIFV